MRQLSRVFPGRVCHLSRRYPGDIPDGKGFTESGQVYGIEVTGSAHIAILQLVDLEGEAGVVPALALNGSGDPGVTTQGLSWLECPVSLVPLCGKKALSVLKAVPICGTEPDMTI